jgi:hypothetical protein
MNSYVLVLSLSVQVWACVHVCKYLMCSKAKSEQVQSCTLFESLKPHELQMHVLAG